MAKLNTPKGNLVRKFGENIFGTTTKAEAVRGGDW